MGTTTKQTHQMQQGQVFPETFMNHPKEVLEKRIEAILDGAGHHEIRLHQVEEHAEKKKDIPNIIAINQDSGR